MNNIKMRLSDIKMSTRTFGRRAVNEFNATPSDVYHLLRFGYTKRISEKREYHWVIELLGLKEENALVEYGIHRKNK